MAAGLSDQFGRLRRSFFWQTKERGMKKTLALTFWAVGSLGAVLWTCFWVFGIIYTRTFHPVVLILIGLGIVGAWEGFQNLSRDKKFKLRHYPTIRALGSRT